VCVWKIRGSRRTHSPAKFAISSGVRWKLGALPCYTLPFVEEIIACAVSFFLLSP